MGKRSVVWEHFRPKEDDDSKVVCIHSGVEFSKGKQGTTTHLLRYMQKKFPNELAATPAPASHSVANVRTPKVYKSSGSKSVKAAKRNNIAINHGMDLLFIQTGGIIDKDISNNSKHEFVIGVPAITRVISGLNCAVKYRMISVCKKNGHDVSAANRETLKKACLEAKEMKIIVTHGADCLLETAQALALDTDLSLNKLVILTGATSPQTFRNSDAEFNIGVSIGACNLLQNGIYIAMNGLIVPADNIARDNSSGLFMNNQTLMDAAPEAVDDSMVEEDLGNSMLGENSLIMDS